MSDLICRKSMTRCLTPGVCSPHAGCQPDKTEWQSGYDEGRRMGTKHMYAEVDRLKAENEALRTALIGTHQEAFEAYFRCCAIANGKDEAWVSKNLERAEDGTYMRAKAYDGWCYWMAANDFAAETILKEGR